MTLVLHAFWRSGASYRVRIGLNLKRLPYEVRPVDIRHGAQDQPAYRALDPQGLVPTLEADGAALVQSLAILEWLEETHPDPPLLPAMAQDRAVVRAMAAMVACDVQPVNNLRVLRYLKRHLGASDEQIAAWQHRWMVEGFAGLEPLIARHGSGFAFGERPTLADCCLIPQVHAARRIGMDLGPYPHIVQVDERAQALAAFEEARPDRQPDAQRDP